MKAQRRLGLALSSPWITSAFLTDVAVLVLAQSLARRSAHRGVVGGCRRRGGGDDHRGTHLPWDHGSLSSGQMGMGLVCCVELAPQPGGNTEVTDRPA
jgi:hypothetical protein